MGISAGGGFASKFVRNHGHYDPAGGYRKRGGGGKWTGGDLADGYGTHGDAMPWSEYEAWQREICLVERRKLLQPIIAPYIS